MTNFNAKFKEFAETIAAQAKKMQKAGELFTVDIPKEDMSEAYLNAFPEGTNEIFKERRRYDCNTCKHFLRHFGKVVSIDEDLNIHTVWDCYDMLEYPFNVVAEKLRELVLSKPISHRFGYPVGNIIVGAIVTRALIDDDVIRFNHLYARLDEKYIRACAPGEDRNTFDYVQRSLNTITQDACDTVLELIASNSIYRGPSFEPTVVEFLKYKKQYDKLPAGKKELFVWRMLATGKAPIIGIRNTAIGTLLVDLVEGVDLEEAVKSFEQKVAPENYQRPKPVVTQAMINDAKKTIKRLGLEASLPRRHATISDVSVNDVLWANADEKTHMKDALDELFDDIPVTNKKKVSNIKQVKGGKDITMETFIKKVLPKAQSLELFVTPQMFNHLLALSTAEHPDAEPLFAWGNPFCWSYKGGTADYAYIANRVQEAGGVVDAPFRASLAWDTIDDLDIHLYATIGGKTYHIYYGDDELVLVKRVERPNKDTTEKYIIRLDVDANRSTSNLTEKPVENIYCNRRLPDGEYKVVVHNYRRRVQQPGTFEVEVSFDNVTHSVLTANYPAHKQAVELCRFNMRNGEVTEFGVPNNVTEKLSTQKVWGVSPNSFVPVQTVILSPNHWESGNKRGNKHYIFTVKEACPDELFRGFYNEFLRPDLRKHRRVFEVLGSKMRCEPRPDGLTGFGFSETAPVTVPIKVTGKQTQQLFNVKIS